jgi:hypothetical protein
MNWGNELEEIPEKRTAQYKEEIRQPTGIESGGLKPNSLVMRRR